MNESFIYLIKNTWLTKEIEHGWGNGYVALPKGHKYYGMDYDHIMDIVDDLPEELTYAKQEGDFWVVGWDSCHSHQNQYNYPLQVVMEQTRKLQAKLDL